MGEQRQVQHRRGRAQLLACEQHQQCKPGRQHQHGEQQRLRGADTGFDAVNHADDPGDQHQRLADGPFAVCGVFDAWQQHKHHRDHHRHDRDVDQKHRPPPEVLKQCATDQRAHRGARRAHSPPQTEGQGAFFFVFEGAANNAQHTRHDHRAAQR